ncbi:MAG: phosphocholine cytidylyltransferase family protein [Rhodospirillales bacterium]
MKAIILAAGVGSRLYGDDGSQPPKSLLKFDGKTLMHRHIDALREIGIESLTLVVGYRHEEILAEALRVSPEGFVNHIYNPRFRNGPVVSLWEARETLMSGERILFMDADVLYPVEMLSRLVNAAHENCFLFDEDFEGGDEPVRLCIRDNMPVEFGKGIEGTFDRVGEWPGFLCLAPGMAAKLADWLQTYIDRGEIDLAYEPAMRDMLLSEPPGSFGFEDITGLPWIEIDFPADLERAKTKILPAIQKA